MSLGFDSSDLPPNRPAPATEPALPGGKARWATPALSVHGDLRGLTMGPSPGTVESGPAGTVYRPAN